MLGPDARKTALARARYQRIAPFYDLMEVLPELRYRPWRERLWSLVKGPQVLEVGVGTGRNLPYYPEGVEVTAIDLTLGMLKRARKRARELDLSVDLQVGDAQNLNFPDGSFDTAVASFVFCSVPDPVLGLRELRRVVRPGGQVLLMEHVRSAKPLIGSLMDLLNPLVAGLMGPNINRRTVENVHRAGLVVEWTEDLGMGDIFKLIIASQPG